jgi:hypothetical protein
MTQLLAFGPVELVLLVVFVSLSTYGISRYGSGKANVASYSPAVLEQQAAALLRRAQWVILCYTLLGALIGGSSCVAVLVLGSVGRLVAGRIPIESLGLVVFFVVQVLAVALGLDRAFVLRVQAHTMLCQVQIEKNTRALVLALAQPVSRPSTVEHIVAVG